jgi:D-tyrosyl-tRNA(Tyr) deacylase
MKAVLQRVSSASVSVEGSCVGAIGSGLLILLGVEEEDCQADCEYLAQKIAEMRIFADEQGKMNKSIKEISGQALVVSQFTLMADWKKGRRPAFTKAAHPAKADELYQYFVKCLQAQAVPVETGIFAANMQVSLTNDGPVTFILEHQGSDT